MTICLHESNALHLTTWNLMCENDIWVMHSEDIWAFCYINRNQLYSQALCIRKGGMYQNIGLETIELGHILV